jgi:hypothetical protein
MLVSV